MGRCADCADQTVTRGGLIDTRLVMVAGAIALVVALAFAALLVRIEKPRAVSEGAASAGQRLDRIEALLARRGAGFADPPNAICQGDPVLAAGAMQKAIETNAAGAKLGLANFSVTPGDPEAATLGLVPVSIQFEANGAYADVIGLLRSLSHAQPEVFATTVALRTQRSAIALKFNGRFFCSISALL